MNRNREARDAEIGRALRAVEAAAHDGSDDDVLAARIVQAARPRLAELRRGSRPWWEWTAGWARIAVPVGIAASVIAGVLALTNDVDPALASDRAEAVVVLDSLAERAVVLGFGAPPEEGEPAGELIAQATDAWLLAEVLDR